MEVTYDSIPTPRRSDLYKDEIWENNPTAISTPRLIFSQTNNPNQVSEEDSKTMDTETESEDYQTYDFVRSLPVCPAVQRLLPFQTRKSKPKTLVLDLDETLVHSEITSVPNADQKIAIQFNNATFEVFVKYRPGLKPFLEEVAQMFEIVLFTASHKAYAEEVLKKLDPHKRLIRHRLFREACVEWQDSYIKDLRVLGRDLSQVIILDNSVQAFAYHLENGIPIKSWFNEPKDQELERTLTFLRQLLHVEDVRPVLKEHFKLLG